MATPKVTITIGGKVVSGGSDVATDTPPITEDNLFMTYVQATLGDVRRQWIVFPPAQTALGCTQDTPENVKTSYLFREQSFVGNRSKWFFHKIYDYNTPLSQTVSNLAASGWKLAGPFVVPLEMDDYKKYHNDSSTPHKALRAVDRVLEDNNLSIKE